MIAEAIAEAPAYDAGRRSLTLTRASSIEMRPVHFLLEGRFPLGSLGLAAGREGLGKSTWCYGFAADVSRGRVCGKYLGIPKNVIIAATEDSWSHTIVPRLVAAGADLERVFRIDVTTSDGSAGTLTLPADTVALEEVCGDGQTAVLLLDPLLSRLDANLDTHKDAEVRRALEPIAAMLDRTGVFGLGLIHMNKSASTDPLSQVMASRAFAAVPRAVLVFARDPEDESRILVGQPKNNLGRIDLPTLRYRIEPVRVAETDEGPVWATRMVPDGESPTTITEALDVASGNRTATSEASAWLEDYMESVGGVVESKVVKAAAREAGHSTATLDRARVKLRIAFESHGYPRRSYWRSPVVSPSGESEITDMNDVTETTGLPVNSVASVISMISDPPRGEATEARRTRPCPGATSDDPHGIPVSRDYCFRCGWGGES